jgi:hypothetical protein
LTSLVAAIILIHVTNNVTSRSRSAHRRRLDASTQSVAHADRLHGVLTAALLNDPTLASNPYFEDAMLRASELVGEMNDDLDDVMTAALEDGFGPEDFE